MFRTAFVVLATMACVQARALSPFPPGFPGFPNSQSSGESNSGITQGETITPGGISTVTQQKAQTGGQASFGGTNLGTAGTGTQSATGLFGSGSTAKTNAESVQSGGDPFAGFPGIPGFPGFGGIATGAATGELTQGTTKGVDGSKTTITNLGVSAGGTAKGPGAVSINKATGSTSSVDTVLGSETSSNLDTQSSQSTGR